MCLVSLLQPNISLICLASLLQPNVSLMCLVSIADTRTRLTEETRRTQMSTMGRVTIRLSVCGRRMLAERWARRAGSHSVVTCGRISVSSAPLQLLQNTTSLLHKLSTIQNFRFSTFQIERKHSTYNSTNVNSV